MIPVQDPLAAVGELRRAHDELGFPAAFVRPNPCCGRTLSHPAYEPLWNAAEELDMAIGIHEGSSVIVPTLGSDRPFNPLVLHAVSHSFEEMLAFAELVAFGVLERHPHLQLLFLESSGGWVPFWLERLDEQAESFGDFCPEMKLRPSEYFARQCFVSYEIDETSLPLLAPVIGEERIVWGSDYPHHDATFPGAVLRLRRTIASMAQPARRLVLGDNARRAYGLPEIPARPTSYANAYFGAIATRDGEALFSLFAPDADLLIAGATISGAQDIVRYHQRGVFAFADLLPRPGPAVPCADGVRVDGELRLEGHWHRVVHTFEIRAGRIRRLTAEGELASPASLGIP
jgi:predicted TIM-barrel fold metal-dependent hydrolase